MRDWNEYYRRRVFTGARSVAYLWGIETDIEELLLDLDLSSVAYLWGIETAYLGIDHLKIHESVAYLWGIETALAIDLASLHGSL